MAAKAEDVALIGLLVGIAIASLLGILAARGRRKRVMADVLRTKCKYTNRPCLDPAQVCTCDHCQKVAKTWRLAAQSTVPAPPEEYTTELLRDPNYSSEMARLEKEARLKAPAPPSEKCPDCESDNRQVRGCKFKQHHPCERSICEECDNKWHDSGESSPAAHEFNDCCNENIMLRAHAQKLETALRLAVEWAAGYRLGGEMDAVAADQIYREGLAALSIPRAREGAQMTCPECQNDTFKLSPQRDHWLAACSVCYTVYMLVPDGTCQFIRRATREEPIDGWEPTKDMNNNEGKRSRMMTVEIIIRREGSEVPCVRVIANAFSPRVEWEAPPDGGLIEPGSDLELTGFEFITSIRKRERK